MIDYDNPMQRRDMLKSLGALTAIAAVGASSSALAAAPEHKHHQANSKHQAIVDESIHCEKTGEICLQHCFQMFKDGDTSLAECAEAVKIMVSTCSTLVQMALFDSAHLVDQAKVAIAVLKDCEDECLKHKEHRQCQDCADACVACTKACKAILT